MVVCGIDIGSTSIEIVLYNGNKIIDYAITKTGAVPNENTQKILTSLLEKNSLNKNAIKYTVVTGYGRNYYKYADFACSEIICHSVGVNYYFPETYSIIEIGGQDSKLIQTDGKGKAINFAMNDRCAAGTGKFIEMIANILNIPLKEASIIASKTNEIYEISSMCAVFAESEVISLIHQGIPVEAILKGIYQSVAKRVLNIGLNIKCHKNPVVTGGVANNIGVVAALIQELDCTVNVPPIPQITGGLGAAIIGYNYIKKE
ncbi:2-hydroxyisocaproyl-CoA dehydratase activator [Desulfarculales bacterium]